MFLGTPKKQIFYKTDEEVEYIRKANILVSKALAEAASIIKPGMTGVELDRRIETFIADHHGKPAFKGYRGFPNAITVSVNDEVVHGIPKETAFKDGDVVSVDCGIELDG